MSRFWPLTLLLAYIMLLMAYAAPAQMPPKHDRSGEAVAVVLNDSSDSMTIEYHSNNEWLQLKLDPGKDGTVTGDRVRVATMRPDKAIISVDMPVEAGKKYRLAWNSSAAMWDLRETQ